MKLNEQKSRLKFKTVGYLCLSVAAVILLYFLFKQIVTHSNILSGLLGAIVGGCFTMIAVFYTSEYREIELAYNELPSKIRKVTKLRGLINRIKDSVGRNDGDIEEICDDMLEVASQIDGETYARCVDLNDLLIQFNHKCTEHLITNSIGDQYVDGSNEDFLQVKKNVFKELVSYHKTLLDYEDRLTRDYR